MPRDYSKGDDWRLYYDSASNWSSPTWVQINAFTDPAIDPEKNDIEIPEQNNDTGHLQGHGNPSLTFTLMVDKGDNNVETLIASSLNGAMVHLALARGELTGNSTNKYYHMESVLFAPLSAARGAPASYDMTARRHINSDNGLTRATDS